MPTVKCKYYSITDLGPFYVTLHFIESVDPKMISKKFKDTMGDNYILAGHTYGSSYVFMGYYDCSVTLEELRYTGA